MLLIQYRSKRAFLEKKGTFVTKMRSLSAILKSELFASDYTLNKIFQLQSKTALMDFCKLIAQAGHACCDTKNKPFFLRFFKASSLFLIFCHHHESNLHASTKKEGRKRNWIPTFKPDILVVDFNFFFALAFEIKNGISSGLSYLSPYKRHSLMALNHVEEAADSIACHHQRPNNEQQ